VGKKQDNVDLLKPL